MLPSGKKYQQFETFSADPEHKQNEPSGPLHDKTYFVRSLHQGQQGLWL
jgi:hypothetical protein